MTDPWARPSDDGARAPRPPAQAVEIELDGPGAASADEPVGDEPNWRAVAGLASVAGVVLGLIVAAVIFWGGGDDEPTTTTVPFDELAAEITTPPTLPPVETSPPVTTAVQGRPLTEPRPITVPTYPPPEPFETPWPDNPTVFPDLRTSAIATITSDTAFADEPTDSLLLWDATNLRFELRFDVAVGTSRTIYDVTERAVYEAFSRPRSGAPVWTRTPADRYFPAEIDPAQYFERILLGPVRDENVAAAIAVEPELLTRTVGGVPARRTTYTMPESAVTPWGADDGTLRLTYDVYVDQAGTILRTQGVNSPNGSEIALVHDLRSTDVTIELPDEDDVSDAVDGGESGVLPTAITPDALRPDYETVDPLPATSSGQYSIGAALEQATEFPPAAASVDVVANGSTVRFTAQRDDANDRRLMTRTIDATSTGTVQIDDAATAATLVTDDVEGTWTRLLSTGPGSRLPPVDERLVSGVVPPDAIENAEVLASYRYVALRDDTVALEAHLRIDAGVFALPSIVPMTLDPQRPVEVYVYVGAGVVHEFHVLSNQGDPRVLVQRFDLRARPEIALPDEARVIDG